MFKIQKNYHLHFSNVLVRRVLRMICYGKFCGKCLSLNLLVASNIFISFRDELLITYCINWFNIRKKYLIRSLIKF